LIDVNDETPVFEKALYEFILTADLRNFTIPAYIKAIDNDAEAPNNLVRYEIIHGNYEKKFLLNEVTGQLTLREPLTSQQSRNKRQTNINNSNNNNNNNNNNKADMDVFVLTARAFDLGVPVRFSTTTVRIYPPESRTRAVSFVVDGFNPNQQQLAEMLSELTGGRVVIQTVTPYVSSNTGSAVEKKSVVTATVIYDNDQIVDVTEIKKRLSDRHEESQGIVVHEDAVSSSSATLRQVHSSSHNSISQSAYKAENRVLFWMLIFLALLLAIGILTLLLCCICSWCPLYAASR